MRHTSTSPTRLATWAAAWRANAGTLRRDVRILRQLGHVGGVRPWHFALPVALMLMCAALEGASMALLVPLAKGLAGGSFNVVWEYDGFRVLQTWFPDFVAFFSGSNRRTFLFLVGVMFAISLAGVVLGLAAARTCAWRNGVYAARVKSHALARCLSFGKLYFDRTSLATIFETVNYSEVLVRVLAALEAAANSAFRLIANVAVMLLISWPMTIFIALAFPALRAVDRWIIRRSTRASEQAVETQHRFAVQIFNLVASIPLVKAFALEARARVRYEDMVERIRRHSLDRDHAGLAAAPLQQTVALFALFIVVVVAVGLTGSDRVEELSVLCAFLFVARRTVPLLGFVTDLRVAFSQVRLPLDRLADAFDDQGKFFVSSGTREFTGLRKGIEFRNVSFSYADGVPVLRGLSCTLPAGATTAVVGETGCGKTTIASLIARLYECPPGTVFFDGIDIAEFSRESIARRIGYVGQEPWLFFDTLRANLIVGLDRPTTDEELLEMLDRVRLGAMVAQLPAGLDTEIGDRGVTMSGGEKQRLSIARTLLRRADLVLLDEATSALDSHTEGDVLRAIEEATRGATVVTIAHRLSTVRSADKILVLSRGEVIEEGSWNELVGAKGAFAAMWNLQSRSTERSGDQPGGTEDDKSAGAHASAR